MRGICVIFSTLFTVGTAVPLSPGRFELSRFARSPWRENIMKWIRLPFADEGIRLDHYSAATADDGIHGTYWAMTFGQGHVITYDGRHYHIPGGIGAACPHILSRDQPDVKFMILKNSRSITLYTKTTVVTLHSNNKVEVNNTGSYRDLPVRSWDNSVTVTHDNEAVVIHTKIGVMIECDLHHKECLYKLTGSYYNHTTGLLGTNDADTSNDFLMPSGRVAAEVQEFINGYELSGSSICRPAPSTDQRRCTSEPSHRCRHLFTNPSSKLAVCHSKVPSEPFMMACVHDVQRCDTQHKEKQMCDAVRAYIRMCQAHGVKVLPPMECSRCHQTHRIGSTWTEGTHKKLDIVLAVSLSRHLLSDNTRIGTLLSNVFDDLVNQLRSQAGIHNVRVGLLGFGSNGALNRPHVYTVQGESFTRHYSAAIWREILSSLESNGPGSNPLLGIKAALRYPFRRDAIKIILLFSEQTSGAEEIDTLKSQLKSGVILNVVTSPEPELYQSNVRGINLRPDIAELVRVSHGSAFDINSISSEHPSHREVLSKEILHQVSRHIYRCRQCTCQLSTLGTATSVCELKLCF